MGECDALVRGREGWIFSPGYPGSYGGARRCDYVVQRATPDTCRVEATLLDFDVAESPHCLADALDLRDAQAGVLCGALASGTKKQLQFRSGQYTMTLRFHTDKEDSRKGFMIQLKQIPKSCGATTFPNTCNRYLDSFTGTLASPGYPQGYPPNSRCTYTIRRADSRICKVLLEFRRLDFGSETSCRTDYIQLPDASRICAPHPTRKLLEFGAGRDLLTLTFVSDGYGSGAGFDVEVLQVPDSCSAFTTPAPPISSTVSGDLQCDQEVSSVTGHFTSPRFPAMYGSSERCRYTLRKADPSVCSVELDFRRFQLEHSGPRCSKDYLALPSLDRLCGSVTGKQLVDLPKESDSVNLYFVSDGFGQGLGFDIHVTQLFNTCEGPASQGPCDQEVGGLRGRLTSPGYPAPYPPQQRCAFRLHRAHPSVCQVSLQLRDFQVDAGSTAADCDRDFLLMPDRSRLCGSQDGTRTVQFPAGSDILSLNFFSDAYRSGRGFDIEVTQRMNSCTVPASECGGEVSGAAGRISSPGHPRFYRSGLRCRWRIRRPDPSVCAVRLQLRAFDVAPSAGCSEDYLQMPDGERLCGPQPQSKVVEYSAAGGDVLTLTFVTDSLGAGRGFDIVVQQVPDSCSILPPPPSCDVTVSEERAVVHSPGYPADYPGDALCVYTVQRADASVCQLQVQFLDFDLEPDDDCASDFVQLQKNGQRFCGAHTPPATVLNFDGDIVRMVFRSDSATHRRGFEARIRQIRNSCYRPIEPSEPQRCGSLEGERVTLESAHFPLRYAADTDCEYRVLRHSPRVCQLELLFAHFELPDDAPACSRDYLQVQGTRYCGKRDGQRVLVDFPKEKNEVVLHFKTDSYQQLSGFRIEAKQLTTGCPPTVNTSCDASFSGESFQLMSPGFQAGAYPPHADCRYTVRKSSFQVCALQLKFYSFDVEEADECANDFLQVDEHKLCGRMEYDSVRTYEFLEDEMIIKFHSNGVNNGAGFFLLFEQKTC